MFMNYLAGNQSTPNLTGKEATSREFCYHVAVSEETIQFKGALIREQNVVFAIVEVSPSVLDLGESVAQQEREKYRPVFPDVPIVLAARGRDGRARFLGRPDIVRFLVGAGWSRIPWKQYQAKKKDRNPFRDWA
jgi:hypothetical protein